MDQQPIQPLSGTQDNQPIGGQTFGSSSFGQQPINNPGFAQQPTGNPSFIPPKASTENSSFTQPATSAPSFAQQPVNNPGFTPPPAGKPNYAQQPPIGGTPNFSQQPAGNPNFNRPPVNNPNFQQPPQNMPPRYPQQPGMPNNEPMTVLQYIGMLLIQVIPIFGIIKIFIWAFGSKANINKKNLARAELILALIFIIIYIVILIKFRDFYLNLINGMMGGGSY